MILIIINKSYGEWIFLISESSAATGWCLTKDSYNELKPHR